MKNIIIATVFSLFTIPVYSQCLTDEYHKKAILAHPEIALEDARFNASVTPAGNKRATKFIIPVVFHVIHTNGPENISKAQIEDQIRVLNEDFSYKNSNKSGIRAQFLNVAADCEIEFRLAQIDPQGNCTDGINRVYNPAHFQGHDNVKSISGARWDYRKYLNIWVISSIYDDPNSTGMTLGFAYLPSSVAAGGLGNLDGIVMRSDRVGTIGTAVASGAGRTLTHEVGHYLGLLHTFDDACAGIGANNGDYCADTPPVNGTFTNQNCPGAGNSCTNDNPDLLDQWENYMDYSQGTCQSMFTVNQRSRMHFSLTNYSFRISLVSASNLLATGVVKGNATPVAAFSSNVRVACVGEPVFYYDNSCKGIVDSKQWTFVGANIASTNKDTPVVIYNTPGKYKVTLMVANTNGNNTLAVEEFIEVRPRVAIDKPSVIQNFNSPTWDLGTGWSLLDKGAVRFRRDSTIGYRGNTSIVAPINNTVPSGQRFQLVTPPVDLRPLIGLNPKISMMVAYVRQNTSSSEELRFFYSRGCDNNWVQFLYRNASFISYNSGTFSPTFTPTSSSQWKQITFSLSNFEKDSNISFMIEVASGEGNPVYIDEINIGQFNTSIQGVDNITDLNIYPNPTGDVLNVTYNNIEGETEVWLENIEGKRICTLLESSDQNGPIQVQYTIDKGVSSGVYILKIRSNNQVINKKVIFAN